MKLNSNSQNFKVQNSPYLVKFDPMKNSWTEEVIKCDIPVIFSCGDCNKFEKIFNEKFFEEKLIFKVVKANFLNEKGKSKNPIPLFMFMLKGELIYQFSADSIEVNEYFKKVFVKIKEFSVNNIGIKYLDNSNTPIHNTSNNIRNSLSLSTINNKFSISFPVLQAPFNKK